MLKAHIHSFSVKGGEEEGERVWQAIMTAAWVSTLSRRESLSTISKKATHEETSRVLVKSCIASRYTRDTARSILQCKNAKDLAM